MRLFVCLDQDTINWPLVRILERCPHSFLQCAALRKLEHLLFIVVSICKVVYDGADGSVKAG